MNIARYSIGTNQFVSDSVSIEAVIKATDLVPMSHGPTWVPGLFQHEGQPVVAIEIGKLMGIELKEYTEAMIVKSENEKLALLISEFGGYLDVLGAKVQLLDGTGDFKDILPGVLEMDGTKYHCLNINSLFNSQMLAGSHK